MAPEAVMILIDSSEYMRNGDFQPTRFEAQSDAISVLFSAKINSNPENTVGVMTMGGAGGKGPEVLATPTADLGKVLSAMHNAHIGGESDLATGINVAQLALKHRQNKTQRQRIIILIGSPLTSSTSTASSPSDYEKDLIKLGKKLKKNNVAVDVVSFAGGEKEGGEGSMAVDGGEGAEESGMEGTLKRFVESVGSGDNSHFLSVSPGLRLLSDMIVSSPILAGEDAYGGQGGAFESGPGEGGSGGGGGSNFEFGVDPDMDPELAMVLRMSMEEEQARLAASQNASSSSTSAPDTSASAPDSSTTLVPPPSQPAISVPMTQASGGPPPAPLATTGGPTDADDEGDEELRKALALSAGADAGEDFAMSGVEGDEEEEEDEEEAMRKAIEMSLKEEQEKK